MACQKIKLLSWVRFKFEFSNFLNFNLFKLLAIPLLPIQVILSFGISRFTTGRFPMSFYMKAYQLRLFCSVLLIAVVYATPKIIVDSQSIPIYYYVGITFVYLLYQVLDFASTLKNCIDNEFYHFVAPFSLYVCG